MRTYYVYILASRSRTLYVGVTSNVVRRVQQHREGARDSFTARYKITRLVYVEVTSDVRAAIAREKQIKAWGRDKKVALIQTMNPTWKDLGERWLGTADSSLRSE
jgi:putative endonuclease